MKKSTAAVIVLALFAVFLLYSTLPREQEERPEPVDADHNITTSTQSYFLRNDADAGWCLVNGPLYIAPYDDLTAETAFGYSFLGNLAHIEARMELYTAGGAAGQWLQVTVEPRGAFSFPAFWLKLEDAAEYNEENRTMFTGPFEYKDTWTDAVTGEKIVVKSIDMDKTEIIYSEDKVNEEYDIFITFEDDDEAVGRDKGVGRLMYCPWAGPALSGDMISLDRLGYPDIESHGSVIFEDTED